MKLPAKQIIRDYPIEDLPHRRDFETCPCCDTRYKNEKWNEHAIILVLREIFGKHEYCGIVSECPKCFEKSWVHNDLRCLYDVIFGEEWEIAGYKEYENRKAAAQKKWEKSLCITCKNGKRINGIPTLDWVDCKIVKKDYTRSSRGHSVKKCEHYKKQK